jgi:hypothetical protein
MRAALVDALGGAQESYPGDFRRLSRLSGQGERKEHGA